MRIETEKEFDMNDKNTILLPIPLTALWLFATILTTSCTDSDCMVADVVTPVNEAEVNAKGCKLAIITTGMQDKVVVVSLFKKDVQFDDCGKPKSPVYDEVVVENGKKVTKITIENNKINLEYSSESGETDFQSIPVEFK